MPASCRDDRLPGSWEHVLRSRATPARDDRSQAATSWPMASRSVVDCCPRSRRRACAAGCRPGCRCHRFSTSRKLTAYYHKASGGCGVLRDVFGGSALANRALTKKRLHPLRDCFSAASPGTEYLEKHPATSRRFSKRCFSQQFSCGIRKTQLPAGIPQLRVVGFPYTRRRQGLPVISP
jgi:hypothetical protein